MHLLQLIKFFCLFHFSHFVFCLLNSLYVHCKTILGPFPYIYIMLNYIYTAVGVGEEGEKGEPKRNQANLTPYC